MPVPTSYTEEEYYDYLRNFILMESADSLDFENNPDASPSDSQTIYVRDYVEQQYGGGASTPPYWYATYAMVTPGKYVLEAGTVLTFSGGAVRTLLHDFEPGDEVMHFVHTHAGGPGAGTVNVGDSVTTNIAAVTVEWNPIYESITNYVLEKMGLSDISEVNETNVRFFRRYGRVEVLKRAMQQAAAEYPYQAAGDFVDREIPYAFIRDLYQKEDARLENLEVQFMVDQPQPFIPVESESSSSKVKVIW
jgi:hypothetical protein